MRDYFRQLNWKPLYAADLQRAGVTFDGGWSKKTYSYKLECLAEALALLFLAVDPSFTLLWC